MSDESTTADAEFDPTAAQADIITADEYPMRVLAGAGTGKTFTMVRKIRRLLRNDVPPEDILALTFTNKATDSIREKLVDEIGPRANDIDAYTYHAIGESLLSDRPYQAGLDPRYDIATEVDQLQLVYQSLDAMSYWFTSPRVAAPGESGADIAGKLRSFIPEMKGEGIEPDDLIAYLGEPGRLVRIGALVEDLSDTAEAILDYGRWRKPTPERLESDMIQPLRTLRERLDAARGQLRETGVEADFRAYFGQLDALCADLIELFETRQEEIVDGPLEPTFRLPALLFNAKYSGGDATGLPRISQTPLDRLETLVDVCQTARDLTEGYAVYERRLDEENLVDFADLVTEAEALLDGEADAGGAGTDWEYVFCDEFQDTDTVQFDLVAHLVGDGNLFVVGDVYQAIYEWRGANIENIEQRLTERFQPVDRGLRENFRSYEPILDLANGAFEQHPGHDSITELVPAEDDQRLDRGVATIAAPENTDSRRKLIDGEAEATRIVEGIMQLLGGETDLVTDADLERQDDDDRDDPAGYRPEDIAILVRARNHARPIIDELTAAGIPYELGGSLAAESLGVRTVISYLKFLANRDRDTSLNRVLTMRYRLHDADLETLNRQDEPLYRTLLTADLDDLGLVEPERAAAARADVEYLLSIRDTHSLTGLYEELKDRVDLEWFLTEAQQADLTYLDELIAEYGREQVQPELSEQFIDFLRFNADTVLEGSSGVQDQPETSAGAVNIMTVHKSKGLEFPVVFLPRLSRKEWQPQQRSNAALRHALREADATPFDESLVVRDEYEQRRAFHVAITRAENLCVLSGRSGDGGDDEDEALPRERVAELLPDSLAWCLHANQFPIWETVEAGLPDSAVDWTPEIERGLEDSSRDAVTTPSGSLAIADAYRRLLRAAEQAVSGTGSAVDPTEFGIATQPVTEAPIDLLPKHSYSSIDDWETCQRQHYLDHVVDAFEDPDPGQLGRGYGVGTDYSGTPPSGHVSSRAVGTLFHRSAERADRQSFDTPAEREARWRAVADSYGRYDERVRRKVHDCITVFFETAASRWRVRSTERWFDFIMDSGHRLVGQIDAVCEDEDGNLVIVDYKTTHDHKAKSMQYQLPIYMDAATRPDMVGATDTGSIDRAALVYVNDEFTGESRVVDREYKPDWVDARMNAISATIDEIEATTYASATTDADTWCFDCAHRSLSCSTQFHASE